jgi:hypothetical protein
VAGAIARVEALAASTTMAGAEDQLAVAVADWNALVATSTHDIAAGDRARFDQAVGAANATIERETRERVEQERREAQIAARRAARASLCELVEAVHGEDALDRVEQARSEWEGLPEDPEADVHERF